MTRYVCRSVILLLSNSLCPPPKHLAARAGYLSTRLTTAVYTRVRLDCQALVSASSALSPSHTPLRLGEESTPSDPKHLAVRAGHRSTRLAHAVYKPPSTHPSVSGGTRKELGTVSPLPYAPGSVSFSIFTYSSAVWPRCSRSSWMGRSSEFVRSSTAISHFFL